MEPSCRRFRASAIFTNQPNTARFSRTWELEAAAGHVGWKQGLYDGALAGKAPCVSDLLSEKEG